MRREAGQDDQNAIERLQAKQPDDETTRFQAEAAKLLGIDKDGMPEYQGTGD